MKKKMLIVMLGIIVVSVLGFTGFSKKTSMVDTYNSLGSINAKNDFLNNSKVEIINNAGADTYNKLWLDWNKEYKASVVADPNKYASWNIQNLH